MKIFPFFLLLLASTVLVSGATDLGPLLEQLSGPDFEDRQSARNALYAHAIETAGSEDPETINELGAALIDALA